MAKKKSISKISSRTDEGINTMSSHANDTESTQTVVTESSDSGCDANSPVQNVSVRPKRNRNHPDYSHMCEQSPQKSSKKPKTSVSLKAKQVPLFEQLNNLKKSYPSYFDDIKETQHTHTIRFCVSNSNKTVKAMVEIWREREVFIRIVFTQCEEVIKIDTKFGKIGITRKLRRLENFITKIKTIGDDKENLFLNVDWSAHIECKHPNIPLLSTLIPNNNIVPLEHDASMIMMAPDNGTPAGFPELDSGHEQRIELWLSRGNNEFITQQNNIWIYGNDIHCLRTTPTDGGAVDELWLNDNIINLRMNLLVQSFSGRMRVLNIDCQFWKLFCDCGYIRAKLSFNQHINVFNYDVVLIPLCSGDHWRLLIIYPKQKRCQLYDSMKSNYRLNDFDKVKEFLNAEAYSHKQTLDTSMWIMEDVEDIPQQENRYDCGVFVCAYAEYALHNRFNVNFTQANIPYFRKKILYEVCTGRLIA